jgi:hypothetical protein
MTTPEIITAVKDIIISIAAILTASAAIIGLKNWSRELKGKTEFETARGIIRATYKLRDEIEKCRSPLINAYEFPEGHRGYSPNESFEEKAQALAHVYKNRWEPVWNALLNFDAQTLEAEALWGIELRNKTDEFRQCVRELNIAIEAVISDTGSGGEEFNRDKELGKEMRSKVSSFGKNKNELSNRITKAINGVEELIRPHLKRS